MNPHPIFKGTKRPVFVVRAFFIALSLLLLFHVTQIARATLSVPSGFSFSRDLHEGDSGDDVQQLQILLNSDPSTIVSSVGPGSPGNETLYLGLATIDAIARFQNKYAEEVLYPAGISRGMGFVGYWTRKKLNQLIEKDQTNQPSEQNENNHKSGFFPGPLPAVPLIGNPTSSSAFAAMPALSFASVNYGPVGTRVTLTGTGFSAQSNTVTMSNASLGNIYNIQNLPSKNSTEMVFAVPLEAKTGRYDLSVSNSALSSTSTIPFMVTIPGAPLPVIEKIEFQPSSAQGMNVAEATFGTPIKITGKNFTPKDNIVSTNYGVFRGISSEDGKTLTFTIPLPEYLKNVDSEIQKKWFGTKDNLHWPVWVRIVNENGPSTHPEASKFLINL